MLYYLTIGERPNQKLIIVKLFDLTEKVNFIRLLHGKIYFKDIYLNFELKFEKLLARKSLFCFPQLQIIDY